MQPLILFVCTGNICRSPMAAALFQHHAASLGEGEKYRVASAGTWGMDGSPAADPARELMSRRGINIDSHRARTVTREMIDDAALTLVMTRDHKYALAAEFPDLRGKIRLISELDGIEYDISDPYGRELAQYETCAADLDHLIVKGYPQIAAWVENANTSRNISSAQP